MILCTFSFATYKIPLPNSEIPITLHTTSLPYHLLILNMSMNKSIFLVFAALFVALINAQQSINGIALLRDSFQLEEFSNEAYKRDLDANGVPTPPKDAPVFQWPRIDGPPENFPPLKDLK